MFAMMRFVTESLCFKGHISKLDRLLQTPRTPSASGIEVLNYVEKGRQWVKGGMG